MEVHPCEVDLGRDTAGDATHLNGRLKIFWGADDAVLIMHLGLATLLAASPRREGTLGKMRLGPVQKALQANSSG